MFLQTQPNWIEIRDLDSFWEIHFWEGVKKESLQKKKSFKNVDL